MHVVKLTFEFETKLDLLFVILCILSVVFLKFESHLTLVHSLTLELFAKFVLSVEVLFEDLLVVGLLLRFLLVLFVECVQLGFVLFTDLTNEHTVVSPAAVLKQNGEYFPDISDH